MDVKRYIDKLFVEGTWACAYRKLGGDEENTLTSDPNVQEYQAIPVGNRFWCADPFLVEDQGKIYMFCEMMDRHKSKGMIGVAQITGGKTSRVKRIKELACHTSYPCVFYDEGNWYMIPETLGNRTIELYRATAFPDHWALDTVLLEGCEAVDTTVYREEGVLKLFIYHPGSETKNRKLSMGRLNMETRQIEDMKEVWRYPQDIGRPAGKVMIMGDQVVRPTQYGVDRYGERIIYKAITPPGQAYSEADCGGLSVNSIRVDKKYRIDGVHTINRCGGYEVIDVHFNRFHPLRPWVAVFNRMRKWKMIRGRS